MQQKWKKFEVTSDKDDAVDGVGDDGRFELRRQGAVVTSVEGLEQLLHHALQ
jgi:hypothetical protein